MYRGAVELLDLTPDNVALVAAHIYDCAAAKAAGLKAIYVRRPTEDLSVSPEDINNAITLGQADAIVDDLGDLVRLIYANTQA